MCQQTFTLKTHSSGLFAGGMQGMLVHTSSHFFTLFRGLSSFATGPCISSPTRLVTVSFKQFRELILVNHRDRLAIRTDVAAIHAGRIKWHRDIAVLINGDDPALASELN